MGKERREKKYIFLNEWVGRGEKIGIRVGEGRRIGIRVGLGDLFYSTLFYSILFFRHQGMAQGLNF